MQKNIKGNQITDRTETSYTKQSLYELKRPYNYSLLPFGFVMGKALSKTATKNILESMK